MVPTLAAGSHDPVIVSEQFAHRLLCAMVEMLRIVATGKPPGPCWVVAKCPACGYQPV